MLIIGFDHVLLPAPRGGEDRARYFFGTVLGLTELKRPESHAARPGLWFSCGSSELHVGIDDNFVPQQKGHPAISVSSCQELTHRLESFEWQYKLVNDDVAGVRQVYVSDPFGNRIEFIER